ncbi:MAG: ArsR family transcriptional regulator [Fibrobacterota bacterium]
MEESFSETVQSGADAARLLGHPARIEILRILSSQDCCIPGEIFSRIPLSRGTVNQHLKALKEAGWIETTLKDTGRPHYCLRTEVVKQSIAPLSKITKDLLATREIACGNPAPKEEALLFLCTGNSCRSQMAEAFFNTLSGDLPFRAYSAGTSPADEIHPLAVKVMEEKGIPLDGLYPKSSRSFLGKLNISLVIFVCSTAEKDCPYLFPFARRRIQMPFEDPAKAKGSPKEREQVFRRVRDQIEEKVKLLLEELTPVKETRNE